MEAAPGNDDAEVGAQVVYHAVKIANNVRADTFNVRFALDDASETVSCHLNIDAAIARPRA